jgi:hypothetical protein
MPMTFKRGMRRVALFVGVVGAVAGGVLSYIVIDGLISEQHRYDKFEQLSRIRIVQDMRNLLRTEKEHGTSGSLGAKGSSDGTGKQPSGPPPPGTEFIPNPGVSRSEWRDA